MKKLIDDTLKTADGKWSRTSLTWFVSMFMSGSLGIINTILSYTLDRPENATATNIFNSFMLLVFGLSGVAVANKIVSKVDPVDNQPNTEQENL